MQQDPIAIALSVLKAGGLVGLPTETVYGLAADAKNETAVCKIFTAKGRPADHPLIVHIGREEEVHTWAIDIHPAAFKLMQAFWPGPLTLILPKHPNVSKLITGGQDSIGIRMPRHPLALQLLQAFGSGVVAPSANQFGHISPTRPEDVAEELQERVDFILPGGPTEIGIESTIVDARKPPFTLLRQGMITPRMLAEVLGEEVQLKARASKLRVSGNLPSHYAPYTPLVLLTTAELEAFIKAPLKAAAIILSYSKIELPPSFRPIAMPKSPEAYAHELYARLRQADHEQAELILVEQPPSGGLWEAIHDRLQRAAAKN